jgi:1-acyl-sn-glycerol-3-phosphate acyltransferase
MKPLYVFTRTIALLFAKLLYHHRSFGKEHVIEEGAIIAANHASIIDPPLIAISWPHELAFLARSGLFNIKWLGWLIRKLNAFPLSESGGDLAAMRLVGKLVKEGQHVVIFPEGQRSWDNIMQPFKPGTAVLACRFNCPIVPCYIAGSHRAWPRGSKKPALNARTACVFGEPIYPSEYAHLKGKARHQAVHEVLQDRIKDLHAWYEKEQLPQPSQHK